MRPVLARILCLFCLGLFLPLTRAQALPNPVIFSDGYVIGRAENPSTRGHRTRAKFFETEILMGSQSVRGGIENECCVKIHLWRNPESDPKQIEQFRKACTEPVNPFLLSSYDPRWADTLRKNTSDGLRMFHFQGYRVHPFLKSPYVVKAIMPLKPEQSLKKKELDESGHFLTYYNVRRDLFQYNGHIVLATADGTTRRSFHALMQQGGGGNQFVRLDIPTQSLFDYIVDVMATGRKVRLSTYLDYTFKGARMSPLDEACMYETHPRVYRVELLE